MTIPAKTLIFIATVAFLAAFFLFPWSPLLRATFATVFQKFIEDPNAVVAFLSLVVSVICARIAVRESREKAAEAKARLDEGAKYREALETVIRVGQYIPYLKGVDGSIGNAAKQLEIMAESTKEITELASQQIQESVVHLKKATEAAEIISRQLTEIGKIALRAQRDSFRSHRDWIKHIERDTMIVGPTEPTTEHPKEERDS